MVLATKSLTYLLLTFPKLTTTFVDREIFALRERGFFVRIVALHPSPGPISEYQQALKDETHYLYPAERGAVLKAHLHYAFSKPWRYFSTLAHLLTRQHPTLLSHRRTLMHFVEGIYCTYVLRKNPGDHLHAHFLNQSSTIALIVSRMLDIPYSVTVHASGEFYATPMMVRDKLSSAKFIATCTSYNRDHLTEMGKDLFAQKVIINYHGLDLTHYQRHQEKPADVPVIVGVGQLMERKGFINLVKACALLRERGVDFKCRIIGEGPERKEMEAEIRQLGLTGCVELTGLLRQEDVIQTYEQANIFALPAVLAESGDRDGIPNVILEAMAMELPVVSTWHSGIPEVIEDGKNGLLVPPGDPSALADALAELLTHREAAQQMGCEGRRTVVDRFDPQKNIQVLVDAFMA